MYLFTCSNWAPRYWYLRTPFQPKGINLSIRPQVRIADLFSSKFRITAKSTTRNSQSFRFLITKKATGHMTFFYRTVKPGLNVKLIFMFLEACRALNTHWCIFFSILYRLFLFIHSFVFFCKDRLGHKVNVCIGRDFDRSLWPGFRAFELSCCPGGWPDIWIFVRARDYKSFHGVGNFSYIWQHIFARG